MKIAEHDNPGPFNVNDPLALLLLPPSGQTLYLPTTSKILKLTQW